MDVETGEIINRGGSDETESSPDGTVDEEEDRGPEAGNTTKAPEKSPQSWVEPPHAGDAELSRNDGGTFPPTEEEVKKHTAKARERGDVVNVDKESPKEPTPPPESKLSDSARGLLATIEEASDEQMSEVAALIKAAREKDEIPHEEHRHIMDRFFEKMSSSKP